MYEQVLNEITPRYKDKINLYKVNIEEEPEIAVEEAVAEVAAVEPVVDEEADDDKDIRKKFGDLFMWMSYIKKIENNENEAREKLLTYVAENHSELQYRHSFINPGTKDKFENFLIVLE